MTILVSSLTTLNVNISEIKSSNNYTMQTKSNIPGFARTSWCFYILPNWLYMTLD